MLGKLIYPLIGRGYLWIIYRKKEKVQQVLIQEYDGTYFTAGAQLILQFVGVLLIALLLIFLIAVAGRMMCNLLYLENC